MRAGSQVRAPRRRRLVALLTGLGLLMVPTLAACTSLPRSGPVVDARGVSAVDTERASDLDALPPSEGASQVEVVSGFLDAMTASPIRLDVAREYLSNAAASEWNPEASTITYAEKAPATATGSTIGVQLSGAQRLNGSGVWQGNLPTAQEQLRFSVVLEDGEYRISDPRNALIVPASWFAQRFAQASLYYFDRSAQILVPQPVFVSRGEQVATSLISALIDGPGDDLDRVLRTFIPVGLRLGLSAPVAADGVATLELIGESGSLPPGVVERMMAQLAWTLGQVPGVTGLRVTIGGAPIPLPGGNEVYSVSQATAFDPVGFGADDSIFALQEGRLARADRTSDFTAVGGPFAGPDYALRSVALGVRAEQAAAVSEDGTTVWIAPAGGTGEDADADESDQVSTPVRVLTDGDDVLRPAWDYLGRTWLVDRGPAGGARIRYFERDRLRTLQVPGLSGRDVTSFLVSRDGTRMVAVVAGPGGDSVRVSRIESDPAGRVIGSTQAVSLDLEGLDRTRILDLAWTSPTSVVYLSPVVPGELSEVRTLTVDGAPTSEGALSSSVPASAVALAGSPETDSTTYAVTPSGLIDLESGSETAFVDPDVTSVGYPG